MKMEVFAAVEITNKCLLIVEEGVVVWSNVGAPPPDDEVIHL